MNQLSAEYNKKKVGIMGGTFDPIHIGHLILGERAYEQFNLEKVLFMPSGNPPHKRNRQGRATDAQRIEMVKRAIQDNPHFELSLAEMSEEGYTYTYQTLERLRMEHPDTEYYFIIGEDSLLSFETWREPQRICDACTLVTAIRDNRSVERMDTEMKRLSERFQGRFFRLDTPYLDISSHAIRVQVFRGESIRYYVPDAVRQYVLEQNIYRIGADEETF